MTTTHTAPTGSFETTPHEPSLVEDPPLVCECVSKRANKHGTCYFSHTKSTQVKRRFRTHEGVQSSLKTQMTVRTVKHGFISRGASLARMRELFPEIEMEAVIPLFTETKKRYLWSRDLEAG